MATSATTTGRRWRASAVKTTRVPSGEIWAPALLRSLNLLDSSTKPLQANAGDYHITDVAEVVDRPERLRLTLRGATEGATAEFHLFLPRETVAQAALARGDTVTARSRVYGVEFARVQGAEPFFLVLHDAWYRQLATHPVTL